MTLTEREREVFSLYLAGYTREKIATALMISPHTVKKHLENIRSRTDSGRMREAIVIVTKEGLV